MDDKSIGLFDKLREENNGVEIDAGLKDILLQDIDTPKNQEGYYLDAFGGHISFNGIRQLKRPYTKLTLNQYQQNEIAAVHNDYYYFRRNYCKIVAKSGISRPDPRGYQKRLEDALTTGDDVLAFWPRQSGKSVTVSTYLLWKAITTPNINIGIAANVQKLAVEVLDKIKKIYIEMPIWLQPGLMSWNKKEIEFDNGTKIMTSATNSDSFRGFSIHLLFVDEVAFIRPNIWEEFSDAVFPAQDALANKQTILTSTAGGLNHWYFLVEGARKGENGYLIEEADWREVPRWNKDGTVKEPEQFKKEQIAKNGVLFWNQNFANEFLGSSATLISGTVLKNIDTIETDKIIFNTIFRGLRMFEEPKSEHYYIVTVDPKVDGADKVGIHVIDVTNLPFRQVAAANLEESYMLIPSRIFDLGTYYNNAMIVVENNMDMNIADSLYYQYDYDGEIYVEKTKKKNNRLGFRTTTKTKKIILSMLKKFIEERLLEIRDRKTLDEMFNFIEKKNGTYSAEEGYHDDLIMSLVLVFAPFINVKDWSDFKGFINLIENKNKEKEQEENNTVDFLDLGIGPDSEQQDEGFTKGLWEDPLNPVFEH